MSSRFGFRTRHAAFGLVVALGLGTLVRVLPAVEGPLTSGDGGLFVVMVDDLRGSLPAMPEFTTYNGGAIPFVYPPLALYGAAVLAELVDASSLAVVRFVPLVLSLLTLGAFAVLAGRLLAPAAAVGAVMAYALMPHAYDGIVAGGGLTRGAGLLLALLAMILAASRPGLSRRSAVGLGVLLGLAALSHPQAALFGAASSAVFAYRAGQLAPMLGRLVLAAVVAGVVVAPWLLVVANEHGLGSLFAAGHRWEPLLGVIRIMGLTFSGAAFADLFLVLGVLGFVAELALRRFALPALVVCLVLAGEAGAGFMAAVPWALLAGAGFGFLLAGIGPAQTPADRAVRLGVAGGALFLALLGSLGSDVDETSRLQRVTADQVAAMAWVAEETDPETRFIVASTVVWGADEVSEWFPAIAGRQSVATVQGSEWLGFEGFTAQRRRHIAVLTCTALTDRCMAEWSATDGLSDAWLFIPKGQVNGPLSAHDCCPALRETVQNGGRYEVVYDGKGATIARPAAGFLTDAGLTDSTLRYGDPGVWILAVVGD
jgi:hypothetical protein